MLEKIKSEFFNQLMFYHLYEKTKLEIIKYNKKFQKQIKIDLINYKFWSKKYIEFETNEKGKEYDSYTDKLIFEGEYLNGQRNGKGKEYEKNKLIFEGEYLNGQRNGKGKEYD